MDLADSYPRVPDWSPGTRWLAPAGDIPGIRGARITINRQTLITNPGHRSQDVFPLRKDQEELPAGNREHYFYQETLMQINKYGGDEQKVGSVPFVAYLVCLVAMPGHSRTIRVMQSS